MAEVAEGNSGGWWAGEPSCASCARTGLLSPHRAAFAPAKAHDGALLKGVQTSDRAYALCWKELHRTHGVPVPDWVRRYRERTR